MTALWVCLIILAGILVGFFGEDEKDGYVRRKHGKPFVKPTDQHGLWR